MPYKIRKLPNSERYKVFNSETGKVHSEHATKKNAKSQMRLLYSLDNGDSQFPKEDQSDETAGEGINHKGRKKGAKNKNKKAPKPIVFGSRIPEEAKAKFHEPLTRPIGNYITTWRWVLYREKEKQGITYPIAMKQHALKELYYKLKAKCDAIDEALREKAEEEGDDPDDVPKTFTTEWLEANWDKHSKRLPQLWQEQLCGKQSGRKKKDEIDNSNQKIDKFFKPPQPPQPPPQPPQPPPEDEGGDQNQNIQLNIEEKDDAGDQQGQYNIAFGDKEDEGIELPQPDPAPISIPKAILNIENKLQELKTEGEKHGLGTKYEPESIIGTLMYIHLLEKYHNNCAVITTSKTEAKNLTKGDYITTYHVAYEGIDLRTDWKEYPSSVVGYLANTIEECVNRGVELILIPMNMRFFNNRGKEGDQSHANVLVIRPLLRIAERFEPHGQEYGNSKANDIIFNKALKKLVEEQMTYKIGKYKYRSPEDVCPRSDGFQSFEAQYQKLLNEGGGFCAMWSVFLMELVLMNPDYTTKDIIKEAFRITNKDPQYLKEIIRGYTMDTEKVLDQLLRTIANEEFKFKGDPNKKKDKNRFALHQFGKHSKLLKNYAIQVIFNLNSQTKDKKEQPDEPIYEETEVDQEKADADELFKFLKTKTKKDLLRMMENITLKNGGNVRHELVQELSQKPKDRIIATILKSCETGTRIDGQLVRDWYANNPYDKAIYIDSQGKLIPKK